MATEPLKVAVIGCGHFGEVHAATYAEFGLAELVMVCDADADRAKRVAEKFGCRHCTSAEEVAAGPDIQAVSIATPDFAHRDASVAVARAGKHVLIEKPLATSVPDAQAITDAVREAGVVGMVDFHNRCHPALTTVKDRLDRGEIGRAQMRWGRLSAGVEVATEWFGWSGRSGPEWFLGSHLVDLACWMFGRSPVRVFAEGRKDVLAARGIDCYDSMQIHLSFPEGFATLETSWILPDTWPMICDFFVSLQTTEARADVDMGRQGTTIAGRERYDAPILFGRTPVGANEFGFFSFAIRDFVRAALTGGPSPMPLAEGLENVKLVAAAVESAETGKIVEVSG